MQYDQRFFDYVNSGSVRSAEAIVPKLAAVLPVCSVLDVGCGAGAWLAAWLRLGTEDALGIDGDYMDRGRLLIPIHQFHPADLVRPFHLGRRFDLVQSVEVAEHLPAASSDDFVASLVRHADVVLFSAAVPGQGGDHHINEQSLEYWRIRFARHTFCPIDYLRPLVARNSVVEPWYRYNLLLYVRSQHLPALPEALRACAVPDHRPLDDPSPWLYRCRKAVLRHVPTAAVTKMAKWKERTLLGWRRYRELSR